MKGKISLVFIVIIALVFFAASCTSNVNELQVVVPDPDGVPDMPSPQATKALPVTRQDISPFFLPGLSDIGTVPDGEYRIGMLLGKAAEDDGWYGELKKICEEYQTRFDVTIDIVMTGNSKQEHLNAATQMVTNDIDFMIMLPSADNTMGEIGDLCERSDVPYITIDKRIAKTPGRGKYICSIEQDDYMVGVLTGMSIVADMTEKYGYPKGNIGEIVNAVNDLSTQRKSMGIRRVFAEHEELNVVCSVAYQNNTVYNAANNVLKAFRKNELDGIITVCDDTAVKTLQAVLDTDRNEMVGNIWSMSANKSGLTGVWYGDIAQTVECTSQTGMVALEYALQYLEGFGEDIPPIVASITRVFSVKTPEQSDAIAKIVADMESKNTYECFEHMGDYTLFLPDFDGMKQYYPKHYFEYTDAQGYLNEHEPFTTGDAVYMLLQE